MRRRPEISVVVPVSAGCRRSGETVAALLAATADLEGEILVSDSTAGASLCGIPESPRVRRLSLPGSANAAELRAAGVAEARAPIVALVEPWAIASPSWGRAIVEGHGRTGGTAAVGGPVLYGGSGGAVSLAEFFFEYGAFLPPLPAEASELPVNNVSYPKALLDRFQEEWKDGFWKHFVHRRLREAGVRFVAEPGASVRQSRDVPFRRFCRERVDHGRAYAARRGSPPWRALAAPVLPLLLTGRVARASWRPGFRAALVRSLPLLAAAQGAWALGEALGSLAGDGGSSSRVF